MMTVTKATAEAHAISCDYEAPGRDGLLVLHGGHRARCSCGWWSDCYAQISNTQRAIDVHLRRSQREDFDALIARSSIGAALDDIKTRGIDAHLADLERTMRPAKLPAKKRRAR